MFFWNEPFGRILTIAIHYPNQSQNHWLDDNLNNNKTKKRTIVVVYL